MVKVTESNQFEDEIGHSTLASISSAGKFNQWMYQTISPFCDGEILEIGGGIGNISVCVIADKKKLTITELRQEYCDEIRSNIGNNEFLQDVICVDIVDAEFDTKFQNLFNKFDSVFALNVIEHIEDDSLAIQNCKKLLKPGGRLIILVPAFQALYNGFDKALDHFRRYTKKKLTTLFEENDLQIEHRQYFNFVGILGWWFTGNVLRKKIIPEGQMKLYDFFIPIIKIIDFFTKGFWGLSVIVVGKKV